MHGVPGEEGGGRHLASCCSACTAQELDPGNGHRGVDGGDG